jgi:hypothetical protein
MHVLPIIDELAVSGVQDRGIPNSERILLRVLQRVRLTEFILCLGASAPEGGTFLLKDLMFWFGDESWLEPPYWIFVYTGPGERRLTHVTNSGEPALVLHWGRPSTLFTNSSLEPVLLRLGGIATEALSKPHLMAPLEASSNTLPSSDFTLARLMEMLKELNEPKK